METERGIDSSNQPSMGTNSDTNSQSIWRTFVVVARRVYVLGELIDQWFGEGHTRNFIASQHTATRKTKAPSGQELLHPLIMISSTSYVHVDTAKVSENSQYEGWW